MFTCIMGCTFIFQYAIEPISICILEVYYRVIYYLCCFKKGWKQKQIVLKNIKTNKSRNMSMGITILATIASIIIIYSFQETLHHALNMSITRIAAGDFFIMMTDFIDGAPVTA